MPVKQWRYNYNDQPEEIHHGNYNGILRTKEVDVQLRTMPTTRDATSLSISRFPHISLQPMIHYNVARDVYRRRRLQRRRRREGVFDTPLVTPVSLHRIRTAMTRWSLPPSLHCARHTAFGSRD